MCCKFCIDAKRNNETPIIDRDDMIAIPPRTIINNYLRRLDKHKQQTGERITVKEWLEKYSKARGGGTLLSASYRKRIEKVIAARKARNTPMTRKEVVDTISSVLECSYKQADNYFCFVSSSGKFKLLLRDGKVCLSHNTTTN